MRLSFDDDESFKETIESLRFNHPASNPDEQMGSSNSIPLEGCEGNEDNIFPSDLITLRRVGSSSSLCIQETRRGDSDIQVSFNNPTSNP